MRRLVLGFAALGAIGSLGTMVGCASAPRSPVPAGPEAALAAPADLAPMDPRPVIAPTVTSMDTSTITPVGTPVEAAIDAPLAAPDAALVADLWSDPRTMQVPPPPRMAALPRPPRYATLKGGVVEPSDSDIDQGYFFGGSFGNYFNRFLAVEVESGYGHSDLDSPGRDVETIPLLVNARVTFPVAFLDVYGGGGLGSTFYDVETKSFDVEGWLFAMDAFVGAEFVIRERMTAGLELKYYFTEEIDRTNDRLDSLALLATFGWRF